MGKAKISRGILKNKRRAICPSEKAKKQDTSSRKQTTLTTPNGQAICRKIRREAWFQLMSGSRCRIFQQLAASILVASAVLEVKAELQRAKPPPLHPRTNTGQFTKRSRNAAHP
jgi:hypothetical protein